MEKKITVKVNCNGITKRLKDQPESFEALVKAVEPILLRQGVVD